MPPDCVPKYDLAVENTMQAQFCSEWAHPLNVWQIAHVMTQDIVGFLLQFLFFVLLSSAPLGGITIKSVIVAES